MKEWRNERKSEWKNARRKKGTRKQTIVLTNERTDGIANKWFFLWKMWFSCDLDPNFIWNVFLFPPRKCVTIVWNFVPVPNLPTPWYNAHLNWLEMNQMSRRETDFFGLKSQDWHHFLFYIFYFMFELNFFLISFQLRRSSIRHFPDSLLNISAVSRLATKSDIEAI